MLYAIRDKVRNLFTYGTLMIPDVMQAVSGGSFRHEPAILSSHARYRIKRQVYPAIVPAANQTVHGLIYFELDAYSLQRLDEFESTVYERREVQVHLADGGTAAANAYIITPHHQHLLSNEPWDLGQFKEQYLQSYLSRL